MKIGFISKNLIQNNSEALSLLLEYCLNNNHNLDLIYSDYVTPELSGVDEKHLISIADNKEFFNSKLFINDSRELGENLPSFIRMITKLYRNNIKVELFNKSVNDVFQDALNKLGYSRPLNKVQIKIRESVYLKSRKGKVLGRVPFGYKKSISSGFNVDLYNSKIIYQIYSLYSGEFGKKEQIGLRKIVNVLNSKNNYTKKWSTQSVKNILKNRFYTGIYQRDGVIISGNHEPIISSHKFEFVQSLLKNNTNFKRNIITNKNLNKINLICGYCKTSIIKSSHSRKWTKVNMEEVSKVYSYFECKSYYCKSKNRNKFNSDRMYKILENNNNKFEISNSLITQQREYFKLINIFKQNIKLLIKGKYTIKNLEIDLDKLQSIESQLSLRIDQNKSKINYIEVKKDNVKVLTG